MMRAFLVSLALLAVGPVGAGATAPRMFRTPSGNIGCAYYGSLRCDLRQMDNAPAPRPKRCDLDYGDAFGLSRHGKPGRICHGDTAIDPNAKTIAYGKQWKRGGITCTSRVSGLTCTNADGHGFTLRRDRQRLF
jgi:hypothetical protein